LLDLDLMASVETDDRPTARRPRIRPRSASTSVNRGAVCLGSVTLGAHAAAGLIQVNDHTALTTASRAFSWPIAAFSGFSGFSGWRF
jgi:hypothetical protein